MGLSPLSEKVICIISVHLTFSSGTHELETHPMEEREGLEMKPKKEEREEQQRGQVIVILAIGMVGFLAVAGLATDGGILLMRQAQLDRAIDASVLAGVAVMAQEPRDLSDACEDCDLLAREFLAVNGVSLQEEDDFDSEQLLADLPGGYRYRVLVDWESEVVFMSLVGFENIPLHAEATAEYFPMMDIYTNSMSQGGVLRDTNLAILGPDNCASNGDPISPTNSTWHDLVNPAGTYTFRIIIPPDYPYDSVRVELFDPDSYNRDGECHTIGHTGAPPEVYDPNTDVCGPNFRSCPNGQDDRGESCLIPTDDTNNPYWFVRVDQQYSNSDSGCSRLSTYNVDNNPETEFRLFYLRQTASGRLEEIDLAYYTGKADDGTEAMSTDLMWVSPLSSELSSDQREAERMPLMDDWGYYDFWPEPDILADSCNSCTGNGDFIVDLSSETPNIYTYRADPDEPSGWRHLYLQVHTLNGSSENGFEIWAGVPRGGVECETASSEEAGLCAPSNANGRNIWMRGGGYNHDSGGIVVTGLGYLPVNSNREEGTRVSPQMAYVGREFANQQIHTQLFDFDDNAADPQIYFFLDLVQQDQWGMCWNDKNNCITYEPSNSHLYVIGDQGIPDSADNVWLNFPLDIPAQVSIGETSMSLPPSPLRVNYETDQFDNFTWRMSTYSRPFLVH